MNVSILHQVPLKPLHTFGIDVNAHSYFEFSDVSQLTALIRSGALQGVEPLVLGGGSNFLPVADVAALVIHPVNKGIRIISQTDEAVWVEAAAGEVWDDLVAWAVQMGFYGLENLSLIPGHVGAAPVQNVGAYGVEAGDAIHQVHAIDLRDGSELLFSQHECRFGYRDSIFKSDRYRNQLVVTRVMFRLSKLPVFHLQYGNLSEEVARMGEVTLSNVRQAVMAIRMAKLPDPAVTGNAGSFFKNPVVDISLADRLKMQYPHMPVYPVDDRHVKLPAGWLIDTAGWKGVVMGQAGVHPLQALVLINRGQATGREIVALAHAIEQDVLAKFGVHLEKEVNIIGDASNDAVL
ncbi:UDP-N-acetylmuramate dehydrogenase [Breznakibacter xylanolyticus]|uniref:UDP-N-acetylenolpyruvoylglucosamine reductase n=1 Tax=Breznakibacter xylanolyticus TaxID=990 RepID=A0A2W7PXW6_9BACT|nr:UDP-N-acetylmuramate dehydrogenase [Breznakibacter xylanolyticus]PZX14389.1 UDP-N-acetylmuramate dehydrogenase [Breznakibacter xylanolyticus]